MHFAGESSGRKARSIGKAGLDRPQGFDEPEMLLDPSGTANICRHEQPDGSQGDGRDGERNQGLDEGEPRAGVSVLTGALKRHCLEQFRPPPSAK